MVNGNNDNNKQTTIKQWIITSVCSLQLFCSLAVAACYSLLAACNSLLAACNALLAACDSLLAACDSLLASCY